MHYATRETWLKAAIERLAPQFEAVGHGLPLVRVSVGFPGGGSARTRIGEYRHPSAIADQVLDVLVHELCHAVTPGDGHGKRFRKVALAMGLTGRMRSTVAGPELAARLNALSLELGEYPHGQINLRDRKKQSTRMLKVECPACGCVARMAQKWLDQAGAPVCGCGEPMEVSQ